MQEFALLGLSIIWDKSAWWPSHYLRLQSTDIDTMAFTFTIPPKRIRRILGLRQDFGLKSDWIAAENPKSHFKGLDLFFQTSTWGDVFI